MSDLAHNLKILLSQRQISQLKHAKDLCITSVSMSRYCNGTQIPKAETISQIADYFDVSVDALLGRNSSSPIREPKTRSSKIDYQIRQYLDDPGNMIALLLERLSYEEQEEILSHVYRILASKDIVEKENAPNEDN